MRRRSIEVRLAAGMVAVMLAAVAYGFVKPNFNGTWVMDKARSFNNPPGLEQTMIVKHDRRHDFDRCHACHDSGRAQDHRDLDVE